MCFLFIFVEYLYGILEKQTRIFGGKNSTDEEKYHSVLAMCHEFILKTGLKKRERESKSGIVSIEIK